MSRTRWILSNLNVVNIVLTAVLIVFANSMFLPLFGKSAKFTVPPPKKQAAAPAKTTEKPVESKSPSPSDYFLIAEQNIFHPERKIPAEKKDIVAAPPLPKPEFVLYGTLMADDFRIAYMEDRKAPQNTATRGKKQIPVRVGEAMSGFTLKEISADRVVMARGDESVTVNLNDATKDKTRDQSGGMPATQQATPPFQKGRPVATQRQQQPAQASPGPPADAKATQPAVAQPPADAKATQPAITQPPAPTTPGSNPFFRLFNRR